MFRHFTGIFVNFLHFFLRRGIVCCQLYLNGMVLYDPALARLTPASIHAIIVDGSLRICANSLSTRHWNELRYVGLLRSFLSPFQRHAVVMYEPYLKSQTKRGVTVDSNLKRTRIEMINLHHVSAYRQLEHIDL
jgi:hypothetical protein